MADITLGDTFIVESWCKSREQYSLNARTFKLDDAAFTMPHTTEDLLLAIDPILSEAYTRYLSTESLYYGTRITRTHPSADGPYSVVSSVLGSQGSLPLPPQVAVLLRSTTGLLGRRNKGRTYIPFIPSAFMGADGRLTSGGLIRMLFVLNIARLGITGDVGGEGFHLQPVVRMSSSAAGRPYVSATIERTFATMRSRSSLYGLDDAPFI